MDEPNASDDVFFFSLGDEAGAYILVVFSHFFADIRDCEIVLEKGLRIDQDLKLFDIPADA